MVIFVSGFPHSAFSPSTAASAVNSHLSSTPVTSASLTANALTKNHNNNNGVLGELKHHHHHSRSDAFERVSDDDEGCDDDVMTNDDDKDSNKDLKNKVRKKKTRTVFSRSQVITGILLKRKNNIKETLLKDDISK